MNIRDLINRLEEHADEHGDDTQVMIAYQPSYPIAAHVEGVSSSDCIEEGEHHHGEDWVWIVAGGSPHPDGYAPGSVFEEAW